MEMLLLYFLKVNGLIIVFYVIYYLFLRKETFFNKNRWFLLLGLFTSVLLPLITFTKTIWVEPSPFVYGTVSNDFVPYKIENKVIEEPIDWNSILFYVYLGISVVFIVKILIEILSFFIIIKFGKKNKTKEAILIDNESNENPFSFFNHIVFNSQMFSEDELQHIISHEKIHVKEKHSIDVLISKLFCALFWVNPFMWFYQKEMLQNLEYIADNKASAVAQNKINYQKTLLKVVTNQHQLSITNQFYQSLIKKRIVMLNTNPSNQRKSWKYALILPVLSAFMLLFQVETVAQVKEDNSKVATYAVSTNFSSTVTKNTTDEELKELVKTFSNENRKLIISDVKRNKKGEINEIKLLFDTGKTYHRVLHRKSNESINNIQIFVKTDDKGNENCDFIETDEELAAFMESSYNQLFAFPVDSKNKSETYWSFDNMKKDGKEVVLIINGKVKGATEKVKLPTNEELGEMKELTHTEFEKKYNLKADLEKMYYEVSTVKLKTATVKWDDIKTKPEDKNRLFIINGKEYLQNEIPKGTTVSVDGAISELSKEEGIKKYGQKAKDGVLIFNGKSIFVTEEDQVKTEIESAKNEIEKAKIEIDISKPEIERSRIEIEKENRKVISGGNWSDVEKELKKERELKAQQNLKLSTEELEVRRAKREKILNERRKLMEEKKKQLEIRRKEIEEKTKK